MPNVSFFEKYFVPDKGERDDSAQTVILQCPRSDAQCFANLFGRHPPLGEWRYIRHGGQIRYPGGQTGDESVQFVVRSRFDQDTIHKLVIWFEAQDSIFRQYPLSPSVPVRRSPVAWPNGYIAILFATDCISRMMEESRMRA